MAWALLAVLPMAVIENLSGLFPPAQRAGREAVSRPPGPVMTATLAALRHTAEGAALLLRPGPAPDGQRLRLAKALLRDAIARGGTLLEADRGEMLLLSADAKGLAGLRPVLARLFGDEPDSLHLWSLPHDAPDLLDWSEKASPAGRASSAELVDPRKVEARLTVTPLEELLRRETLLRPDTVLRPAGLRLRLDTAAIERMAGGDPDLAAHCQEVLARRCLAGMASAARMRQWLGGAGRPPLLVDLPADAFLDAPDQGGQEASPPVASDFPPVIAVLPVSTVADEAGFRRIAQALRRRGWGIALSGIAAKLLPGIRAERLAADMLVLDWSPSLLRMEEQLRAALPGRILLDGCDEPQAIGFAARLGMARISGPLPERLGASARMARCAHQARCGMAACMARAGATDARGREGCASPELLAASLDLPA